MATPPVIAQERVLQPEIVIGLMERLQEDPYGAESQSIESRLIAYAKSRIVIEAAVMAPILDQKDRVGPRLLVHYTGGLLIYTLSHEGSDITDAATLAGLHTMLYGYRAMLKARPQDHNSVADRLLQMEDHLADYLKEVRQKSR